MRLSSYFNATQLRSTYILSERGSDLAILVDPCEFKLPLFNLLEQRELKVGSVLLTQIEEGDIAALRALSTVYGDVKIYAGSDFCGGLPCVNLKGQSNVEVCGLTVNPVFVPGYRSDQLMYQVDNLLFTGSLVSAGTVAKADESFGRALIIQNIEETFRSLAGEMIILPQFGPPSSVSTELAINHDFRNQDRAFVKASAHRFTFDDDA